MTGKIAHEGGGSKMGGKYMKGKSVVKMIK